MNKLVAVLVGIGLIFGSFIYLISQYLPVSNQLQKADVIVAISGGDTTGRAQHAIDLYKRGLAPKVIFSGAAKDPSSPSNAKVMRQTALKAGVPASAIVAEETSRNTAQNAHQTHQLAADAHSIILVTSDYHQRRAYREFSKAYEPGVTIINSPANDKNWGQKSWFFTPYGWWITMTETAKLAFSYLPSA